MAKLNQLVNFLDQLLEASRYRDIALNGLQIESSQQDISRIAFAVDSGLSIVDKALEHNVQLLVVHHGVFWGKPCPLTGVLGTKLQLSLIHI